MPLAWRAEKSLSAPKLNSWIAVEQKNHNAAEHESHKFFVHKHKLQINWEDKFNQFSFRLQDYPIAAQHAANQSALMLMLMLLLLLVCLCVTLMFCGHQHTILTQTVVFDISKPQKNEQIHLFECNSKTFWFTYLAVSVSLSIWPNFSRSICFGSPSRNTPPSWKIS